MKLFHNIFNVIFMFDYIYIIEKTNYIKVGSTRNPYNRLSYYQTGEPTKVLYNKLYRIESDHCCYYLDYLINIEFKKYTAPYLTGEGGKEWYLKKNINNKTIENFFDEQNVKYNIVQLDDCDIKYETKESLENEYKIKNKFNEIYSNRDYQNNAIKYLLKEIIFNNKCYLELATGGGKTYITFKIFNILKPDLIICFSPRKKINKQNIKKKYLKL